jgi:transposase
LQDKQLISEIILTSVRRGVVRLVRCRTWSIRAMLALQLQRLQLIDQQIAHLNGLIAQAMKPHQEAVMRLAEVPGLGVDSAQQIIAEVGAQATTFSSAPELTSWVGTCPGKEESAEQNHSSRSAKGNKYLRRVLNQAAHAAVAKKGSHFQVVFRRLLPRLGYHSSSKAAKWVPGKRRNAPRCWREPFVNSAMRSPSPP